MPVTSLSTSTHTSKGWRYKPLTLSPFDSQAPIHQSDIMTSSQPMGFSVMSTWNGNTERLSQAYPQGYGHLTWKVIENWPWSRHQSKPEPPMRQRYEIPRTPVNREGWSSGGKRGGAGTWAGQTWVRETICWIMNHTGSWFPSTRPCEVRQHFFSCIFFFLQNYLLYFCYYRSIYLF